MSHQLTKGFIAAIEKGEHLEVEEFRKPIVQIYGKTFLEARGRKRIAVSDGLNTQTFVFIKDSVLKMIDDGSIQSSSIIRLTSFQRMTNAENKSLYACSACEVLQSTAPMQGNPTATSGGQDKASPEKVSNVQAKPPVAASTSQETASRLDYEMKDASALTSPAPKGPPTSALSSPPTVAKKVAEPQAKAVIPMSQGGENVIQIEGLSPYMMKWTIRARVVAKQPLRTIAKRSGGASTVFTITLMDQSHDIKASFWNDAAEKFEEAFVVGKCYTFSKGKVQMTNQKYNDTKSQYEITFNSDAIVFQCEDSEAPSVSYKFCSIEKLDSMIGKSVDVLGVVTEISSSAEITIKSGAEAGKQKLKRNITIADETGKQISLTLWDDHAMVLSESDASRRPIIAARSVRVGDYGGCSLSTGRSTILEVDAKTKEVDALRAWYDAKGGSSTFQAVGGGVGGAGGANHGPAPRKNAKDIWVEKLGTQGKGDFFTLRCTVLNFRGTNEDERKWQYPSNPENKKKVVMHGDKWVDESTNKTMDTCLRRYILGVCFVDHTGTAWATAFDDQAAAIVKKSADDLYDLHDADPAAAQQVWKAALFRTYVVKARAKAERYQDEERVKLSVVSIEPVNFRTEGKYLLERIRLYVG